MKTILLISSNYLEAIYKESKKYNINLIGCGNFEDASKLLNVINPNDLCGVGVLEKTLPANGTKDYAALKAFFKKLGDYNKPVEIKMITFDASPANYKKILKVSKNLHIKVQLNVESVTDTLINKGLFGSLLKRNGDAYVFEKHTDKAEPLKELKLLCIDNLLSQYLLDVTKPVISYGDIESTEQQDHVLQDYDENNDGFMAALRKVFIRRELKEPIENELLDNLNRLKMEELRKEISCERMIIFHYVAGQVCTI